MTYLPQIKILVPSAQVSSYSTGAFNLPSQPNSQTGRALFAGSGDYSSVLDYVNIATTGNATGTSGLIKTSGGAGAGFASTTRAFVTDGNSIGVNTINFKSLGFQETFGDRSKQFSYDAGCQSETRGVLGAGIIAGTRTSNLEYLTSSTLGNFTPFGDLTVARFATGAFSSNTRGVWGGGGESVYSNVIDYIQIATTGNATDFGDLVGGNERLCGSSSNYRGIWYSGWNGAYITYNQYITISSLGNAASFGNPSGTSKQVYHAASAASQTRGLHAGGSNASAQQSSIDYVTIATTGNGTNFGNLTQARNFLIGVSDTCGGLTGFEYNVGSATALMGGYAGQISYLQIETLSDAQYFGDLTNSGSLGGSQGAASTTRAIFGGSSTSTNDMEYTEFASKGLTTLFGSFASSLSTSAGCSNATRGLFFNGGSSNVDYITIATIGNATFFGNNSISKNTSAGLASTTRALFAGGETPTNQSAIDYFTIASTGNYTSFGSLTVARRRLAGLSSNTRGVFVAGYDTGASNVMDYVTIASTGNATDFGDLVTAGYDPAATSSSTRGIIFGGSGRGTSIDYITIASTGNAATFGSLTQFSVGNGQGNSNAHGGL